MSQLQTDSIAGRTDPNTLALPPIIQVAAITALPGHTVSLPAQTRNGIIFGTTLVLSGLTGLPDGQLCFDTTLNRLKIWISPAFIEVGGNATNNDAAYSGRHLPGEIIAYMGTVVPTGYLRPEGQLVSRTSYATLFGAIGTTYGVGDGSTTFALPDCRGRVIMCDDNGAGRITSVPAGVGQTGGLENVALSTPQLPAHSHTGPGGASFLTTGTGIQLNTTGSAFGTSASTATAGSGQGHLNLQPFITAMCLIKT